MILDFLFRNTSGNQRILTSDDLARYLSASSRSGSGVNVTVDRALLYATVYACVRVLAESVGQLPLHLYERRGRDKVKAVNHPLYSLLHVAPNEYQTAQEWREWVVACLALRGNAYCQINRALSGRVLELTTFAPGAVTPKQHKETGEVTYLISLSNGQQETLPAREVLHVKLFTVDSGVLGASPVQYARESVGMGIAAEQHGAALFARGAQPGGVLESTKPLSPEVQKRLIESWKARHEGLDNAHRVAVLEDGLQWKTITLPSKDAQWLEGRKFTRSELAGIWRVPPHKLGDLERATFSNIEQQALDFVLDGILPYCTRIEQRIALQLLEPKERSVYFAKFNERGLLRGDMAARAEYYTRQLQNGALSPNEIRELEDMNPRDGGDVYLTPSNMVIDGQEKKADAKGPQRRSLSRSRRTRVS